MTRSIHDNQKRPFGEVETRKNRHGEARNSVKYQNGTSTSSEMTRIGERKLG